ncbi:glucose 1-dehydrogenase [Rhodophyticola sp. CCM32]|uniref:SDR family NAD(P)-dependent oxidoreductase n=1 Tax=Rhodophyticola sp. CCM32 TaxID=2916397 RepID=UPI00107F98D4|nr:glucose 1-dehydrogenase [Rhodophyticola sp. CCM32]QBY01432.1 glucose 1-dehydrogenase [Rhodophyticola sp. CCM32]
MNSALFNLAGKTALVTGSSRGLGQAMAIGLAQAGAFAGITSRSLDSLEETSEAITAAGGQAGKLVMDVSSPAQAKAAIKSFAEKHDGIDILINNAGYEEVCPSIDVSEALWDKISDTNLKGAFFCAQEAAKTMIASGRGGSIINVCSLTSYVGVPTAVPYGSSKSGLLGMTRALSSEWAKEGIRVNAIAPGYFRTELTDTFYQDDAWRGAMLKKIPMAEFGNAEDLKGTVIFLASNASKYITGQCIAIDGGYLAAI